MRGGIGFFGLLTIVLITLKLTDHIDWSWWIVLAAVWVVPAIVLGLGMLIAVLVIVGLLIADTIERRS